MTDRTYLSLALVFYAISMILTLRRLRQGVDSPALQRCNYSTMLLGFLLHTLFLYFRGETVQRCPLTNTFETTVFVAWSIVLFYLIIGPAYRLSFLGAFTAPLVLAITAIALWGLPDIAAVEPAKRSAWVEFHAAIAVLAYGAFALAVVCAAMYLIQERQLKRRQLNRSFLLLPSLEQLDQITLRLVGLGFLMLSVGVLGGVASFRIVGHTPPVKVLYVMVVWFVYLMILSGRWLAAWRGRRMAWLTVIAFAFVLMAFWGVRLK